MEEKINEELRQFKLFKIQETESKLRRFKEVYKEIKEHIVIKFSKNATSNIFRIITTIICLLLIIIGFICFFPDQIIEQMEAEGNYFSNSDKNNMIDELNFFKYFALSLSLLFGLISYLLKLNNRKRNSIYSLSKLLEEVMGYMESSSYDEKRKYEYFVDSLAEKEKKEL